MVSIETNAKALTVLLKKKERLEKQVRGVSDEINKAQTKLNTQFDKLGLDSNFS